MSPIFLLFSLFFQVECLDKVISLSKIDASFVFHGVQFNRFTRIIVQITDNPNGKLHVFPIATDPTRPKPQAWLADQNGNHTLVDADGDFGSTLTMGLGADRNMNFALTIRVNNAFDPKMTGLVMVQPNDEYGSGTVGNNTLTAFTIISNEFTTSPSLECSPRYIQTPGCSVDMYLGGIPSQEGMDKYRLITFTNTTISQYRPSIVYGVAVTYIIPENCSAMVDCRTGNAILDKPRVDENSIGFFVSYEYPGLYGNDSNLLIQWSQSYGWTVPSFVNVEVVSVDPGSSGNLTITAGSKINQFKQLNTSMTVQGIGNRLAVNWYPSDDVVRGFLARYTTSPTYGSTYTPDPLMTTTKISSNTNWSLALFIFCCSALLSVL